MNIIEAVKSGKKFRRKDVINKAWYLPATTGWSFEDTLGNDCCVFDESDILSEEWEIEEETFLVTKEELRMFFNTGMWAGLGNIPFQEAEFESLISRFQK